MMQIRVRPAHRIQWVCVLVLLSIMSPIGMITVVNTPSSWIVNAFTVPYSVTIARARSISLSSSSSFNMHSQNSTPSKTPYEDYMDALQKQQQQYQSFRQLNTVTTYESNEQQSMTSTSTSTPSTNTNAIISEASVDTTRTIEQQPPPTAVKATNAATAVWTNGWNGNNVLNAEQQQPTTIIAPPKKSNYMYQKPKEMMYPTAVVAMSSSVQQQQAVTSTTADASATTTATFGSVPPPTTTTSTTLSTTGMDSGMTNTDTATQPRPTFGSTVTPAVVGSSSMASGSTIMDNQPATMETSSSSSSSTNGNQQQQGGDVEGRPVFPSYPYTTRATPTTTNLEIPIVAATTTPASANTPANTTSLSLSSSTESSSLEMNGRKNPSVDVNNLNEIAQATAMRSTAASSQSLWDEYNSNRQNTERNQINDTKQQYSNVDTTKSMSFGSNPSLIESVTNENTVNYNTVSTPSNGWNTNYNENNDPEPKKFNFMGDKLSTMNSEQKTTSTPVPSIQFMVNEVEKSTIDPGNLLSDESFLRAITSVETVSSAALTSQQTAPTETTESKQGESSTTTNPFQTFWESNMSKLKRIGSPKVDDDNEPLLPVELPPSKPSIDTRGMTERIMKKIDDAKLKETQQSTTTTTTAVGGAGGSTTYAAFLKVEDNWTKLKQQSSSAKTLTNRKSMYTIAPFVTADAGLGNPNCWTKLRKQASLAASVDGAMTVQLDYDIVICGGTLGIFFALALILRNPKLRICVVESAPTIRGRDQEWNISLSELYELIKLGVLTESDLNDIITTEFPACRSGFKNNEVTPLNGGYFENNIGYECSTDGVLNLGVSPSLLLERVAERFRKLGGIIREDTRLFGVTVSDTVGAALDIGDANEPITTHLLMDCMGNASPISRQQRDGIKPDGICAVVGSCAAGFDPITNVQGDIIYTMDPIQDKGENGKLQYFWEAFPVGIGRNGVAPGTSNVKTTYMFTYMDADEKRPSLETLMEDYWSMLPKYQPSITNPEIDLDIKRVLFAYFPTYTDSPLKPQFSRILPVGDASGIQSPLSFGGFGALTRHLDRIVTAVDEALNEELLQKEYLGEINAYAPNLSAAWMFQKAMSIKMGQNVDETFVNRLLAVNFEVMNNMGQRTIKPFLQDVIRFDGLVGSLARGFVADPTFMPQIVAHVGIPRLADWLGHVSMMGLYSVLDSFASPIIKPLINNLNDPAEKFLWRRKMDAWKFGCGNDYELPEEN